MKYFLKTPICVLLCELFLMPLNKFKKEKVWTKPNNSFIFALFFFFFLLYFFSRTIFNSIFDWHLLRWGFLKQQQKKQKKKKLKKKRHNLLNSFLTWPEYFSVRSYKGVVNPTELIMDSDPREFYNFFSKLFNLLSFH